MRNVIAHATCFEQDWADEKLFKKLKNTLNHLSITKIVCYPSNIVACTPEIYYQREILNNIAILNPILTIHTNRSVNHGIPKDVFLIENERSEDVREMLNREVETVALLQQDEGKEEAQCAASQSFKEILNRHSLFGPPSLRIAPLTFAPQLEMGERLPSIKNLFTLQRQ